ncbi:MAG TPA: heme exporter protein CcmD [Rhizomicrobium sp.]|jgi:heme exporter protein D|nr:heme exporter protein CcmD [Rhizomicrobium sp.]
MSAFWAMGGYAAYVWPAYGVSLLSLAGASWLAWRGYRRARARLAALEGSKPR